MVLWHILAHLMLGTDMFAEEIGLKLALLVFIHFAKLTHCCSLI